MPADHNEPSRPTQGFGHSARHLAAERLFESLASRNGAEGSRRIVLDNLQTGASSTFISLNEVIQNGRERIETADSTEQYFGPDDVGRQRPKVKTTHEVRHVQLNAPQESERQGASGSTRREPHQTATSLVGSRRASIAAGDSGSSVPTIVIGDGVDEDSDQDDFDYRSMSPILGMKSLPSLYDAATRAANGSSPAGRRSSSIPLSARLPVASTTQPTQSVPTSADEAPTSDPGVDEQPPRLSTPGEPESLQVPRQSTTEGAQHQPEESLVESSVLLQVSIVNRSSENLPISVEHNDHSTLEYVQFIETASYRQYSFTSEHLTVPEGFLRRSASGLRRMLSHRNRFIANRSRSFLRRLQREVDIEMQNPDAAWWEPNDQPDGPVELDATPAGPYEVAVSPNHENWGLWGARAELNRDGTFTRSETLSRMTCAIFGPNLSRQLGSMCKVYMKQLDEQLTSSMKNHELQTPNTLTWPNPLSYLEECLKVVASRMEATMSIEDFVQQNTAYLMVLMEQGPAAARATPETGDSPVINREHLKIAHEWMLFCLEAWTMLDMTAICKNRYDLRLSENFCKSPLKDTIESLLPRLIAKYSHHNNTPYTYNAGKANQILPDEMAADMLQELAGVEFVWTNDITKHLALDAKTNTVGLYSHVAFAYLHAEAGTESSLNKSGLLPYHNLLTEISQSYLLLFGTSDRSRKLFHHVNPEGRSPGYFDIFSLHGRLASVKPKFVYNSNEDFPVFGDRLIELKSLLKPKGLRGLWRDTRDSLQWYTFWAVAVIGGLSLLLGVIQMALGAVQAYASLKALHP